jgi:hypothetical protein
VPLVATPVPADVPLWRGIADAIEHSITSGGLPVGSRVPSEHELVADFGASRPTVVKALNHLAANGFLDRRQGIGTFVATTTRIPPTTGIRLVPSSTTWFVPTPSPASTITMVAKIADAVVAHISVASDPLPWRTAEELRSWDVLTGAAGWTGCRRRSTTDLAVAGVPARAVIRVRTLVEDEFSDRTCTITLLLDPAHFSVDIEQPI